MATSALSSPNLHIKISNLSLITQSPLSLTTHYLSRPFKPIKPQKLNIYNKTRLQNPIFITKFAAFDSFVIDQDAELTTPRDDLQSEPEEFDQEIEQNEPKESPVENDEGRLYVGNLPYTMTADELREIFQEAGSVVNVEIIYDRVTDRSRGFGFVQMASVDEAKEAIRLFNNSQIGGRTVRVNFPEVPKGGEKEVISSRIRTFKGFIDSPHKIYAGNLGWRVTSLGLKDAFANQPGTLSAKVIYERDTGRSRGYGFVSFETAEAAEAALEAMNGVEVEGRPLRLNIAVERARASPTETNVEDPPSPEANAEDDLNTSALVSSISS